jgi:long-chain fatty acid transport protein
MDDLAFGCGVYVPFAEGGTDYSTFQNTPYDLENFSSFTALTSAAAYKILPDLSVGAGFSLYMGSMETESYNGALTKSDYHGLAGCGGNLGLFYKPREDLSMGLSMRTKVPIKMDGHVKSGGTKSDSEVEFTFPYYITLGFGYRPTPDITLGLDLCNMQWGDMDRITYDTSGVESKAPTGYKDSWVVGLGMENRISEDLALRAGLRYSQSATKKSGMTPASNDVDVLTPSIGITYNLSKHMGVDFSAYYNYGIEQSHSSEKFDQDGFMMLFGFKCTF